MTHTPQTSSTQDTPTCSITSQFSAPASEHKPDYEIVHNKQAGQWEVRLTGTPGTSAAPVIGYASYDFYDDAILMTHTVVRREYSGMGIAADLVRTALDEIREQGKYSVVPVCSYVERFIENNPEYQKLLPKQDIEPGLRLGD